MNPFEFVLAIIVITGIFSLMRHKMGIRSKNERFVDEDSGENRRLRSEVQELKERIKVLERIAVDKENALAREIDSLRDR